MDGVHDLGGMHGLGPVDPVQEETYFHEPWEALVFALNLAGRGNGFFNIDEFRHSIERMAPADYLAASYYERWLAGIERLLIEKDVLSSEAIDDREAALPLEESVTGPEQPDLVDELFEGAAEVYDVRRPSKEPAFGPSETVRVRNRHPVGHTRCPRYVRRATGTVETVHGTYVLPDASAHGEERAEPLYSVRFAAAELWGSDGEFDGGIHIDLWESYLEPSNGEPTSHD